MCWVYVVVDGEEYEGDCDEIAGMFGVPMDEDDTTVEMKGRRSGRHH